MALAVCDDRICSRRVELAITQKIQNFFFVDTILSTNGCTGTHFMAASVRMHNIKAEQALYFKHMDATAANTNKQWV